MSANTVQIAARGVGGIACPLVVRCALRRGVWAVTPFLTLEGTPVRGSWVVTHVPSGLVGSPAVSLSSARGLCRELGRWLPDFGERAKFGVMPKHRRSVRWHEAARIVRAWAMGAYEGKEARAKP